MRLNIINLAAACILQGIVISNFECFAQQPSEVRVIVEPFEVNYYNNYDMSIKKIKDFIAYNITDDKNRDTLRMERFDKNGDKSQLVSFYNGKRQNVYHYSYYTTSTGPVIMYKHEDLNKQRIVGTLILAVKNGIFEIKKEVGGRKC